MKITELEAKIDKNLHAGIVQNHSSIGEFLKKHGWTEIGSGNFSNVYGSKNKDYILKVNKVEDFGFKTFANFCQKTKSPYLPKISDRKQFVIDGKVYNMYFIEKLHKFNNKAVKEAIVQATICIDSNKKVGSAEALRKEFDDMGSKLLKPLEKYPGLLELILQLGQVCNKTGTWFDFGPDFVMSRGDIPVLSDPIAE